MTLNNRSELTGSSGSKRVRSGGSNEGSEWPSLQLLRVKKAPVQDEGGDQIHRRDIEGWVEYRRAAGGPVGLAITPHLVPVSHLDDYGRTVRTGGIHGGIGRHGVEGHAMEAGLNG